MNEYPRSPEYVAALEKMLASARALRDLATDHMGLVIGASEALRAAAINERVATELLRGGQS